ncbi:uncharacterized protein AMSG_01931 [Thecamonas trahens ATCC 50062]|uniref:Uncharacterized protein n=1 Tax=Thecamonas trahens ATCC 50062 TaxID=461836 RepID=A0A0L0DTT2_THETB|nr:hypothetical protein AMSG_01931 [Thecamonas trahens ATCC 50062]KNC55660.1 hypothetical protein AMSG_01931 [Thecamonas trahens ATCC 50062]|eukprot:XP_013761429.1 hypothetical protein AMSG_01931 [Thecamonas trahens ATCC 50062]
MGAIASSLPQIPKRRLERRTVFGRDEFVALVMALKSAGGECFDRSVFVDAVGYVLDHPELPAQRKLKTIDIVVTRTKGPGSGRALAELDDEGLFELGSASASGRLDGSSSDSSESEGTAWAQRMACRSLRASLDARRLGRALFALFADADGESKSKSVRLTELTMFAAMLDDKTRPHKVDRMTTVFHGKVRGAVDGAELASALAAIVRNIKRLAVGPPGGDWLLASAALPRIGAAALALTAKEERACRRGARAMLARISGSHMTFADVLNELDTGDVRLVLDWLVALSLAWPDTISPAAVQRLPSRAPAPAQGLSSLSTEYSSEL